MKKFQPKIFRIYNDYNQGVIEKINLDFNNHVNIAEYIKLADQSNNKLFKEINSKKKFI